jgi:hypothetical protein
MCPASKDTGKNDATSLDELAGEEATAFRSDSGTLLYVVSGRFDIAYTTRLLSEQMATPLRLGDLRLERLARYLSGCPSLALMFVFQQEQFGSKIPVDSNWASEDTERRSTHSGLEFVGLHLIESWVATDQVRSLSSAEAELYGIVDGAARGIMTQNMFKEVNKSWSVTVQCDSSAAIGMSSRTGVGKVRHIQTRWLWVQDAVRDKLIKLEKIRGEDNLADLGTKALDATRHQLLVSRLPLRTPTCERLRGVGVAAVLVGFAQRICGVGAIDIVPYGWEQEEMPVRFVQAVGLVEQGIDVVRWMALLALIFASGAIYGRLTASKDEDRGGAAAPVDAAAAKADRAELRTRDVASQSQCTYTAVRGAVTPRFQPLANHAHG